MVAEDVHIHIHIDNGAGTPGGPDVLSAVQRIEGKVDVMTDALGQANANLDNISADITTLTTLAQNAASTNDALQEALNQALAAQDQVVADAVNAALADAQAANDAALGELVARTKEIADRTADAPAEPPVEPVDPNAPVVGENNP